MGVATATSTSASRTQPTATCTSGRMDPTRRTRTLGPWARVLPVPVDCHGEERDSEDLRWQLAFLHIHKEGLRKVLLRCQPLGHGIRCGQSEDVRKLSGIKKIVAVMWHDFLAF